MAADVAKNLFMREEIAAGRITGPTIYVSSDKADDTTLTYDRGMQLVENVRTAGYDLMPVIKKPFQR